MPLPPITIGSWDSLDPASNILGRVFDRDPVLRFMLCNLSDEQYDAYLQAYWRDSRPVNAAKKRVLGNRPHYYIFAIGTEHEHQGKGLARALIESQKQTAWSTEVPMWLEATTEYSRDLYLSLGFQEVEQITIGQGKVNRDGFMRKDGEGVTLWLMVWWPQSSQRDVAMVV
ncbi:hypothetical protein BDV11DRAFT_169605 [Aspergillus similis]